MEQLCKFISVPPCKRQKRIDLFPLSKTFQFMHVLQIILINLVFILKWRYCQDEIEKIVTNEINCRERNRLVTTNKGDIYMLVDAFPEQVLSLLCNFCNENDDEQPKVWYKIESLINSTANEVKLGMESNATLNRIRVSEEHSLIFQNITVNDSGFYYCLGFDAQESENKYNYYLDVVFEIETMPETGNLTAWRTFHDETLAPVNKLFAHSMNPEYEYIRKILGIDVEVVTEWEPWGPCEICGRPQGQGQKRKKGLCRLKLTSSGNTIQLVPKNEDEIFFRTLYQISCRSLLLERLFPAVSNVTKYLTNFIQTEHCEGICNPDAEGLNKGWKTGKTKQFKYKKSFVLAEGAHLTLVCPESTLSNVVTWRKNRLILKSGESVEPKSGGEPRISVDTFSTLYLHSVTSEEEGNYTCVVDDVRMQQVRIYVVSKSRLLTQAMVRHMMYLAFVLSLTLTCYCSGLVVTWKKRHTFKTYEDLLELERNSQGPTYTDNEDDLI